MSNDKTAELDILAEAFLPSDLLTPTLGSNYGMDGYPDMEYGMGVLDAVVNPLLHEPPALPTGISMTAAAEMDVQSILDGQPLADLDWLDPTQAQDEERLPVSPVDLAIPELIEAWGVNRRTDGTHLTAHQTDLTRARYEASLSGTSTKKRINARSMERVLTHAMRQSIEGQHIDRVVREASESVGGEFIRIVPHLRLVKAEHGLVGNVFIRAAAYPGWGAGKGKAHAKKHAKQARYIVVSKHDMDQATWIQNGRCAYTGKIAVTEVPWKKALAFYAPRLAATGRKVASGDPKEVLRQAFLIRHEQRVGHGENLPVYKAPGDDLSIEAARTAVDQADTTRKVVEVTEAHVRQRIATWRQAHMLNDVQAASINDSTVSPNEKLAAAVEMVTAARHGSFTGAVNRGEDAAQERHERTLSAKRERRQAHDERLGVLADTRRKEDIQARVATVLKHVERGARGSYLRKIIAKTIPQEYAKEATPLLLPTLKKTGALRDTTARTASYDGPTFEVAQPERASVVLTAHEKSLVKAASAGATSVGVIKGTLQSVRRAMSEGMAGKDLSGFIGLRFTERVLTASTDLIAEARRLHEGASGHLYVDAEAYASPTGSAGCEKAASKHRTNQIPSVASMPRCGSCTQARALEDGTMRCGVYNKSLLDDSTGPEIDRIKAANIRGADMNDAEVTASMFAPTYDPSEFSLHNANLEGIETPLPETEKMSEILFGSWDL
jgi:hypothetical protein